MLHWLTLRILNNNNNKTPKNKKEKHKDDSICQWPLPVSHRVFCQEVFLSPEKLLSFLCQPHWPSPQNLLDKCRSLVDFPWCFSVLNWNHLMQISVKFFLKKIFYETEGQEVVETVRRKHFCVQFPFRFEVWGGILILGDRPVIPKAPVTVFVSSFQSPFLYF